ncbi:hypothetical protein KBI52_09980 [Microvirga sp. HBU67558]|uniref:hypothetical protein n=1 Tax=Microvirga TaxID=186650 RepID=UPI001B358A0E|nr:MULTISPECIES: hypothetical protein [unclassified Microvirga]MBQ0820530.1 hypothetical protein [Microvirga sp. HBU67558]
MRSSPSRTFRRLAWGFAILTAFILPLGLAAALSFLPSRRFEAATWIMVDASRGTQAFASSEAQRAGNELITYDQVLKTQLSIAGSEDVVRKALAAMLPVRLYPELLSPSETAQTEPAGDTVDSQTYRRQPALEDREYAAAVANLKLSVEPNTFILKIAFRHKEPILAAKFANALAAEFLARRSALYSNQGDVDFFKAQEARFNRDLREANVALEKFSRETGVFDAAVQRNLLLEARAHAAKEIADNAMRIARAESALDSLKRQIFALRSRTTLPPEIFGETNGPTADKGTSRDNPLASDPPLLNIKIYQDAAAKLVEANTELAGFKAIEARHAEDLRRLDGELAKLAESEAKFNSLRRSVTQAEGYIDNLSKRAGEAQINSAWRSNEAFSSAQILQAATVPLAPAFPNPPVFLAGGTLVSIFLSLSVFFLSRNIGARRIQGHATGLQDLSRQQPEHYSELDTGRYDQSARRGHITGVPT